MAICTFIILNENTNTLNNGGIVFYKPAFCTCWAYIAKYKNSGRFYRDNGPGLFPKKLKVPKNVDTSTGRMIDEGVLIDPKEYEIIQ